MKTKNFTKTAKIMKIVKSFFDGLFVILVLTDVLKCVKDLVDFWTDIMQQQSSFLLVFGNSHCNG